MLRAAFSHMNDGLALKLEAVPSELLRVSVLCADRRSRREGTRSLSRIS